jgi:hypothetical protein
MRAPTKSEELLMKDVFILVAIIVAWFVLNKYVLPKLGVKT